MSNPHEEAARMRKASVIAVWISDNHPGIEVTEELAKLAASSLNINAPSQKTFELVLGIKHFVSSHKVG